MNIAGSDVRTAREALQLSRAELGGMIGRTVAQVARIETSGPRPDEYDGLEELLRKAGVVAADEPESSSDPEFELPDPPASEGAPGDPDAQVVSTEWRGIKKGQVVKIDGEVGKRFRFGYHLKSPAQEYVSVWSTKNGGQRSFRPERLRTAAGKVPKA